MLFNWLVRSSRVTSLWILWSSVDEQRVYCGLITGPRQDSLPWTDARSSPGQYEVISSENSILHSYELPVGGLRWHREGFSLQRSCFPRGNCFAKKESAELSLAFSRLDLLTAESRDEKKGFIELFWLVVNFTAKRRSAHMCQFFEMGSENWIVFGRLDADLQLNYKFPPRCNANRPRRLWKCMWSALSELSATSCWHDDIRNVRQIIRLAELSP